MNSVRLSVQNSQALVGGCLVEVLTVGGFELILAGCAVTALRTKVDALHVYIIDGISRQRFTDEVAVVLPVRRVQADQVPLIEWVRVAAAVAHRPVGARGGNIIVAVHAQIAEAEPKPLLTAFSFDHSQQVFSVDMAVDGRQLAGVQRIPAVVGHHDKRVSIEALRPGDHVAHVGNQIEVVAGVQFFQVGPAVLVPAVLLVEPSGGFRRRSGSRHSRGQRRAAAQYQKIPPR